MAFILLFETAGYVFSLPPLQIKDKGMPYVMTWLDLDWGSRSELFGVKLHLNLPLSHAGSEHCNVLNPNSSPNFIIVIWSITHSIKRKFNCQDQSHLRLGREGRSLYERLRSLRGRSPLNCGFEWQPPDGVSGTPCTIPLWSSALWTKQPLQFKAEV